MSALIQFSVRSSQFLVFGFRFLFSINCDDALPVEGY